MKFHPISLLVALALPLAANALAAQADGADKPAAAAQTKPAKAKAAAAKKPAAAKPAAAKASAAKAPAAKKTAVAKNKKTPAPKTPAKPAAAPDPGLTEAELATARNIQTGAIQCELGASVTVTADDKHPGYFKVASGKRSYTMHPVESRTGAIRMEDPRAGAVWLQLGTKSMLMDQKLGRRLADECVTPAQREHAAQLKSAGPGPSLLQPKH